MENNELQVSEIPDSSTSVAIPETAPAIDPEKVVDKELVNRIVIEAKEKGYAKGYQKAMEELKSQQAEAVQPAPAVNTQTQSVVQPNVQELVAQELRKQQEIMQNNAMFQDLLNKVNEAATRYPDYSEVTKQVDFTEMPEVLRYVSTTQNAGDVLYDLAQNPQKIATLRGLGQNSALNYVQKLSSSIKQNLEAKNQKLPNEPLDQIKSSYVGSGSSGNTLADLKKIYTN